MQEQEEMLCELWPEEQIEIKQHSRLYHLEPIGVGSPMVESLTSYIMRLATEHSVSTSRLIVSEIIPLLFSSHFYREHQAANTHMNPFWQASAGLNATSALARSVVQAVEQLTLHSDLRFLTMLTFEDILSPKSLNRRMRAWCPECYEEWKETNQIVYEPLLWSLETVCWCSRHQRQLQWHCPYPACQRMMHPLTHSSLPGYCAHCKRWLGSSSSQQSEYDDLLTDEIREMQIWAADAVGELLAAASFMMVPPNREGIAKSLTHFVREVMKGNRAAAARQLGIDRDAIGKWMQKTQHPLLESLVNVSFRLGTTLLGLLTGDVTSDITIEKTSTILEKKVKRPYRKLNKVSLQDMLEAALEDTSAPPRPLTEIAQSLGYSPNQLRGYFPGLCQSVVTRYRIYVASRKEGRFRKELDALQQAICDLHEQGRYPSKKQVGKLLGKHGIFQNPEIRAFWQKTVREFGWGQ